MRTKERGFTLIELMVVLTIIATLVAAVGLGVSVAQGQMAKTRTKSRLDGLGGWLQQASKSENLGAAPSADTSKLRGPGNAKKAVKYGEKIGALENDANMGIETLFLALAIPELASLTRPELTEDAYANSDDDDVAERVGNLPSTALFEIVDSWGNPFVYFAAVDYKNAKKLGRYTLLTGADVMCEPVRNETTGEFRNVDTFQLFSMGPDGVPGTEDDIHFGF